MINLGRASLTTDSQPPNMRRRLLRPSRENGVRRKHSARSAPSEARSPFSPEGCQRAFHVTMPETKQCNACGEEKPLADYPKDSSKKGGLRHECRACMKRKRRAYYLKNSDRIKAARREYVKANKSKCAKADRAYYEKNRDRILERDRKWRQENHRDVIRRQRERYHANKDSINADKRDRYREDPEKREAVLERNRQYYHNNKDRIKAQKKRYREENAEMISEKAREHRKANLERLRKRQREYYQHNKEIFFAHANKRRARKQSATHPDHDTEREAQMHKLARRLTRMTGEKWHVDHVVPLAQGGYHHHHNLQVIPAAWNLSKKADPFWEPDERPPWFRVPDKWDVACGGVPDDFEV